MKDPREMTDEELLEALPRVNANAARLFAEVQRLSAANPIERAAIARIREDAKQAADEVSLLLSEVERRLPIRRGKGDPPEPLSWGSKIVKMTGCPDCGGRGYFLINPFATGGGDGVGGPGNRTQCLTCLDSEAYFKKHGELPVEIAEPVQAAMQAKEVTP